MKPLFLLIVAFFLLIRSNDAVLSSSSSSPSRQQRTTEAYVTLLYGDEFLLGVRVLGKSIRDTGSTKDMVVLVSDGVSAYAMKLLKADGWIVEKISLLANPNQVRPTRFWGVYTKLKIFNMTNYKKVVYLDADTIVVKSVEDLFKCSKFCANLKHSERLNSGVMVVEPSERVFQDMMGKVTTLESYTGGDQGFLNSYYSDFPNAHVFEPNLAPEVRKSRPVPEMERLSTLYNADVGLYMLANKWMVNESELRVIHYTLGPLKPWDWWTSWLLKPVDVWQNVREGLKDSLPGTGGGRNPNDALVVKFLFSVPVLALLFCYYRSFLQTREYFGSLCRSSFYDQIKHVYYKIRSTGTLNYTSVSTSSTINASNQNKVPCYLGGMSIVACFMAAVVALVVALAVVPRQVMPWTGLLLMYEWTFTIFFLLFGGYLHLVYQWGRRTAVQSTLSSGPESVDDDSGKGHQRQVSLCDSASLYYGLGMAFLAVAAPSLPCLFGITALFLRLGLMVVGGLILASFMTYASEHLATRSFLRGLEDRDATRTTTLTGFHFSVTALVGLVSNASGYSAIKHVPFWELLWFSIVANVSITAMNFSLMLNSVGFYQISKLSMIPVVCVMEWILNNKQYSKEVKMSVVVVVIGVGVCTVTDVKVNLKGFMCACLAVLSTSFQQISIGSLKKKHSVGSFELLSKTAPIQATSLLILGPFIDYILSGTFITDYKMSSGAIAFILLSCTLAVFCNISQYLCIGRFSAVSFQVLGHMKTVCVLTLGWLLFDSELTFKNIMGMILAVVGMVIYSWAVEAEKRSGKPVSHSKTSMTEEEIELLKAGLDTTTVKDVEHGATKV